MTAFAGIVTFDGAFSDIQNEDQIGRALAAPRNARVQARRAGGAVSVSYKQLRAHETELHRE
jgi:hypothetical protein